MPTNGCVRGPLGLALLAFALLTQGCGAIAQRLADGADRRDKSDATVSQARTLDAKAKDDSTREQSHDSPRGMMTVAMPPAAPEATYEAMRITIRYENACALDKKKKPEPMRAGGCMSAISCDEHGCTEPTGGCWEEEVMDYPACGPLEHQEIHAAAPGEEVVVKDLPPGAAKLTVELLTMDEVIEEGSTEVEIHAGRTVKATVKLSRVKPKAGAVAIEVVRAGDDDEDGDDDDDEPADASCGVDAE